MEALAYKIDRHEAPTEDHLDSRQFERISRIVGQRVGIKLPPAKRTMVEGRLRRRLKANGLQTFRQYCDLLFDPDTMDAEVPFLINVVTTNKTDFFREPEHYELLEKLIVPGLLAKRTERNPLIKVWSAASSNGAEAYTAAMILEDMVAERRDFRYAVLGTDVSTDILEAGRRAVYPAEMIAPVPPGKQSRYVMHARQPGTRPLVRMAPELRRRVQFMHLNLMDTSYPVDRDVDVIFLRNVLIYFEREDQAAVIRRLVDHLRVGGHLLLGHSESMIGNGYPLRQVAAATFERI